MQQRRPASSAQSRGRSRRIAGRPRTERGPADTGTRRSRFADWGKARITAAVLVALGTVGAVVTSLLSAAVNQAIDPKDVLDSARSEPALRVSVDGRRELIYAAPADFVLGELEQRYVDDPYGAFEQLFLDNGGIAASRMSVTLGVEGRRQQAVRIAGIRPEITRRSEPLTGSLFVAVDAGGSDTERMAFDLDRPQLPAAAVDANGEEAGPFFAGRTITVTEGEVVTIALDFAIQKDHVEFDLIVDVVYGDHREQVRVDDGGRPFAITACAVSLYSYDAAYVSEVGPVVEFDPQGGSLPTTPTMIDLVHDPC